MATPRIDHAEQPVEGRWYLVRAIVYDRFQRGELPWPIIGPMHRDVEFFNFDIDHYHIDVRFLTKRHLRQMGVHYEVGGLGYAFSQPIQPIAEKWNSEKRGYDRRPMPEPQFVRMQCRRLGADYPFSDRLPVRQLNEKYAGVTAKRGRRGWVCPHRKVRLDHIAPDDSGIITCPLHGLRIDVSTGLCAGPVTRPRPSPADGLTAPHGEPGTTSA